jgi:LysM repeat protein
MFASRYPPILLLITLVLGFVLSNARAASETRDDVRYVVKPGDTLWAIAVQHHQGDPRSAVWELQERNGLSSPAVTPGKVLYVPR